MQIRPGLIALLAVALATGPAAAQTTTNTDERLRRAEQRLDELEQQLKARDAKIAELESRSATAPAAPTTQAARHDDIERTKSEVVRDIESRTPAAAIQRTAANFNPDVAVVTDFVASLTGKNGRDNDAYNRFDVREAELDLRAAVDPRADGVLILAFERDVENPIFPGDEAPSGPETSSNIEEAYLFLHDFGVPNLTAKVGRFHVRFGRQNVLHLHDLPTTDPPFVNQAFLSPESLTDSGFSFSYVIPPRYTANQYVEAVLEVLSGEGAGSESPTLAGDLSVDSPALNAHLLWNGDVMRDLNLELGTSFLAGHSDADNANNVRIVGVDATLIRTDPSGGFHNTLFQAEAMYADLDAGAGNHAFGAYVLGQQQLDKDWYAGLRIDWTEDPNDDTAEAWGVTPYVSWYWSEFLRWRFSYQHRGGDIDNVDALWVQATWIFGAHPPHPYWSMR